jgi:hypothetical protein
MFIVSEMKKASRRGGWGGVDQVQPDTRTQADRTMPAPLSQV